MSSDEGRVGPVGESGLWLDGDPATEIEPKPGDRGICGIEGCGDEIVLMVKINFEPGTPVEVLEWEHVDPRLGRGGRSHRAELAERVEVEGMKVEGMKVEGVRVREQPLAHRDRVMNELWNAWHGWFTAKSGDLRTLPQMMFEAMEPFLEGAYEAGQDQWRDWLGDVGKAGELWIMSTREGVEARPKFGKWWVSSDE